MSLGTHANPHHPGTHRAGGDASARQAPSPGKTLAVATMGSFLAFVNVSIVLISLPAIFDNGLHLDPLQPGNVSYLLWLLLGYMVVTAVLVVTAGRLGDMMGRDRAFVLGFAIFTVGSVLCALTPNSGAAGALELIAFRCVQGVGGAFLMANSTALITDAYPANRRGFAVGVSQVFGIAGSFLGLVVGGVLSAVDWRLIFWVSVPLGVVGLIWSKRVLHDPNRNHDVSLDIAGNITFAVGLVALLVGISYGIQPYGGHVTGWSSPFVLSSTIGGVILLAIFVQVEKRAENAMFNIALFRIRAFSFGNLAGLLAATARGGLQFMLIIWLQGIWLPLHGYNYSDTPLWAGIYLLPLTIGFLIAGPVSGYLSDRIGARPFATGGMLLVALSFGLMLLLPTDFNYYAFAALLVLNGLGSGLFTSPNTTGVMNAVPASQRGTASGMRSTFQNSGQVLSIGLFFTLLVIGLASSLPGALQSGLVAHGVSAADAHTASTLPPVATLFAAFLGYNPISHLLGAHVLSSLPAGQNAILTGKSFFPTVISGPFKDGLSVVFWVAIALCVVAAIASYLRGGKFVHEDSDAPRVAEPVLDDTDVPAVLAPANA